MKRVLGTDRTNQEIFSNNLRRYVDSSDKTQKEIADIVGVSAGTFSDWINGRSLPRMNKIQKLAEILCIKMSDLIEEWNPEKDEELAADQKVLELFHKVPKEKREFVLSLIQATIDNL